MIGYLSGTIQAISDPYVIVDVKGVGYRVVLPEKMKSSITEIGSNIKLYTHFIMNPRDGSVELFGFETPQELKFFELITTVSGIGPKSAQSILSKADLQSLQLGIMKGDDKYLSQVAGIGPKTAQRLVLELKTKILKTDISADTSMDLTSESEALAALVALGYTQYQARDALKNISVDNKSVEDKITQGLKILGQK